MIPLTSGQVQTALDRLLESCLRLIFEHSNLLTQWMPALLSFACTNKRRKIDRLGAHRIEQYATEYLIHEPSLQRFLDCGFNRYIIYRLIKRFLESVETSDPVAANIKDLLAAYDEVRSQLLESYKPLCYKTALQQRTPGIKISVEDMVQNMQQAVLYAIDRFDCQKGALTSFILGWMRHFSQSPEFSHTEGLAFNTTHFTRRQIARQKSGVRNIGRPLSNSVLNQLEPQQSAEAALLKDDSQQKLIQMLQRIDPHGILRLLHGVEETWTPLHQQQLEAAGRAPKSIPRVSQEFHKQPADSTPENKDVRTRRPSKTVQPERSRSRSNGKRVGKSSRLESNGKKVGYSPLFANRPK